MLGCNCPRVAAYAFEIQHSNPHPPIRDHSGMRAHANAMAYLVRGSICLASPDPGRFWGGSINIRGFVEHYPLVAAPWGRAIADEWQSVLNSHSGRPPHRPLPPSHPPNGENTKAWDWIPDGNSGLNEWSHLWAIRKSISLLEKTIPNSGNVENGHFTWREKEFPWERKTMQTQIRVNEWYCIHNIEFKFVTINNLN